MLQISTREDRSMGAFIAACLAFVVLGAGGYFVLNELQQPTGTAFSTGAVRIDPSWSWRVASGNEACEPRQSWQWFLVDFKGESAVCSDSQ
jgi:hypothetical protein